MKSNVHSDISYKLMLRIVKVLNVILVTIPYGICWFGFYAGRIASPYYAKGNWAIIALFVMLYIWVGRTYDAFLVSYNRISEMIYSQVLAILVADTAMFIVLWLLGKTFPFMVPALLALGVQVLLSAAWSLIAHNWYFHMYPAKKTFIVWDMRRGMTELIHSYGLTKKFQVVGDCSASECIKNLDRLDGMEAVFLSGVHSHDRNIIIKYCVERHISTFVIPRIGDVLMSSAHRMHMFHLPMLRVDGYNPTPEFLFLKRTFDIVCSLMGMVLTSPIMLVTAICIKKTDGGPVFYKQTRLTKDGKEFDVLKFRSMRVDAEKDGKARLSTGDKDDRITPVGHVIRKCRIDELPQFINILKGDMSLVGPRPERPEIAREYEKELPEFRLRLQAKCGLTGYAQVHGKYNTTPYDKLQMDLMYIANASLAQDLSILFATVKILFMPESTEGIAEGAVTAMQQEAAAGCVEEGQEK
ncbi:sugar transferase [Lachnospiraceae bacterium AM48-27BH]|nr:sugar transferase [Lachnospiraceae bacterium AM48-27BH]